MCGHGSVGLGLGMRQVSIVLVALSICLSALSQSTKSDEALLTRAHGLYDTPFTGPLVSFDCSVQFDWKKHILETLGAVPRPRLRLSSIFKPSSIGSLWTALGLSSQRSLRRLTSLGLLTGLILKPRIRPLSLLESTHGCRLQWMKFCPSCRQSPASKRSIQDSKL